jgi:hypothetical protein
MVVAISASGGRCCGFLLWVIYGERATIGLVESMCTSAVVTSYTWLLLSCRCSGN